ncbi:FtsX-like permease family protein [Roseivirga sp.]|uniref:FtsX-like permease family protein n=1 Tax=Roseivirga sp. TaxID=1964215 RepID=UPI003B529B56
MIAHYLKTSIRAIKRSPLLSALNLLGLSIGLACFLVISLYLYQENTYEKGFSDHERIYRLEEDFLGMGRTAWSTSNLQYRLDEVPEIESFTRIAAGVTDGFKVGEKEYSASRVIQADEHFFEVFDFNVLAGDLSTALDGPNKLVLTKDFAIKLFGETNVVGRSIKYQEKEKVVAAVLDDQPYRSHLKFDVISSDIFNPEYADGRWFSIGGYTYARTTVPVDAQLINEKLDEIAKTYAYPIVHGSQTLSADDWLESANKVRFFAKPIREIYLGDNEKFELTPNGDRQARVTLTIIGSFILLIAVINFMNLSTARSSQRTKEIGLRKVLGTGKSGLISQFLLESVMLTLIAAIIGGGLSELFINLLNQSVGEVISISILSYPSLALYVLIGVIVVGILAGTYPAFYLSSVKMIPLLKGMKLNQVLNLGSAKTLRNSLVVLQFTVSSTLIIGAFFVYSQLQYLRQVDLGFDREQVIVLPYASKAVDGHHPMRSELLRIPGVESASFNNRLPADQSNDIMSVMLNAEETVAFSHFQVDPFYQETLGLNLVSGDWFRPDQEPTDSLVVLNQAAVNAIGFEDDPVGQVFGNYWRVIGVVEDFFVDNYRDEVGPALINYDPSTPNQVAIKLDTKNLNSTIAQVRTTWEELNNEPFEYKYLDQNFAEVYNKEKQNGDAVMVFTVLAIFISCLGLFGLAAFTADQRQHEFGVRKVLGAGIVDIVKSFGLDFIKLILIAFLVAIPLSVYVVNLWLNTYANRIDLGIGGFLVAAILSVLIALGTIAFQSVKTGRLNPMDTLRNE